MSTSEPVAHQAEILHRNRLTTRVAQCRRSLSAGIRVTGVGFAFATFSVYASGLGGHGPAPGPHLCTEGHTFFTNGDL